MQGEALFEAKKRLSRLEEGVSLILLKSLPKPLRGRGCIPRKHFFNSTKKPPQVPPKEGMSFPKAVSLIQKYNYL